MLTALLVLALCAAMSFAAGATEPTEPIEHTHEGATTLAGTEEALTSGTYIVPEVGLELTKKITIAQENDVTVCLNGQNINSTAKVFEVENGAKLTLCNCGGDGGTITTSYDYAVENYGYVILEDNVRLSSLTYTFANSIGATLEMHDTSSLTCQLQNWHGVTNRGNFKLYDSAYIETNEDYMIEIADAGATVTDGGHTGEGKFTIKIWSNLIEVYLDTPIVYGATDTAKYSVCNEGYALIAGTGENAGNLVLHAHADTGMCTCGAGVRINEQNFPDAVFRAYIQENFDTNNDNTLTAEELAAVTKIDVNSMGISSLAGVEYFTELILLSCGDNNLTSLDISALTKLRVFDCSNNKLTALDVSNNTELTDLHIGENCLTAIDVSQNTALSTFNISQQTIHVTVDEAARED